MGIALPPNGQGLPVIETLRFGESVQAKLAAYEKWLPQHLSKLSPREKLEPLDIFRKVMFETAHPSREIVTKQPGQNVWFSVRNPQGMVYRKDRQAGKEKPQGLFYNDMQHLDHLVLQGPENRALTVRRVTDMTNEDTRRAGFRVYYDVQGEPRVKVLRDQRIDERGLVHETMQITNPTGRDLTFNVALGTLGKDIFQARAGDREAISTAIRYQSVLNPTSGELEIRAYHQIPGKQNAGKGETAPPPAIITRIRPTGENATLSLQDPNTANLRITVPAGKTVTAGLEIRTESERFGPPSYMSEGYKQAWDGLRSKLIVQSERGMNHLSAMWNTSFKDLRALTIPVHCGPATFFPAAAGIPNFLALFGRDSLITALQALQYNPVLARDTLAALAYYQGKKHDAFTEEEPGKILHELRLGETTRLGISPHKPYYGTIDATPLFVILFGEYMNRTGDAAFERVMWPNVEAALNWIDTHVIDDPANPLQGFLAQRDKKQAGEENTDSADTAGAQGLKNIGWKDSDAATRHLVQDKYGNVFQRGEDGTIRDRQNNVLVDEKGRLSEQGKTLKLKLVHAKYPLALAEVQAYVYGAWRTAEAMYGRKAEQAGDPQQREALSQKAEFYKNQADALQQRFNEKFWMPQDRFMAMALQTDGQKLASVTTNGAQALMTGIVYPGKARLMARRMMEDDLLSGWGMRTLSADSFAYDPFAYHNGTVWPHDNSLVIMGLARYGFKEEANTIASQLLRAGRRFPNGRLPELYAGLPKQKHDRTIPVYPNTCIPQAWAAGTTPLIMTSLLGLRVDAANRRIVLDKPVLPEGVNAMKISLGVAPARAKTAQLASPPATITDLNRDLRNARETEAGDRVSLLVHRYADNKIRVQKISGPADIKVQVLENPDAIAQTDPIAV